MKTTQKLAMVFLGVLVAVAVAAALAGFTVQQRPAYAQFVKDPGASFFAPGEDPQAPGWDPSGAEEDAPGQLKELPTEPCQESALKCAPGTEGLEAEIIG